MNNKGFMMAEVIVVSAVILVTLVSLYTSYNKIFVIYKERMDYNDVTVLYKIGYIRDRMIDDNVLGTVLDIANDGPYLITSSTATYNTYIEGTEALIVSKVDTTNKKISNSTEIANKATNPTFKDYVNYLSTSATINSEYVMLMEMCSEADSCKYSYLEIYAGRSD